MNGASRSNVGLDKRNQVTGRARVDDMQPKPPNLRRFRSTATATTHCAQLRGRACRCVHHPGKTHPPPHFPKAFRVPCGSYNCAVSATSAMPYCSFPTPTDLQFTALTPDLRVVNHHIALNQALKGFLVLCRIVPAVIDWWYSHRQQMQSPLELIQQPVSASRAVKPLRPPHPKKIVVAGLLLRKAFVKFLLVMGKSSVMINSFIAGLLMLVWKPV